MPSLVFYTQEPRVAPRATITRETQKNTTTREEDANLDLWKLMKSKSEKQHICDQQATCWVAQHACHFRSPFDLLSEAGYLPALIVVVA
jgi:hypothetical protein